MQRPKVTGSFGDAKKVRLAVAGSPIAHSLSPCIFSQLFALHGIEGEYIRIEEDGRRGLGELFSEYSLDGLNLTAPLKSKYLDQLSSLSPVAGQLCAVNAISREPDGGLHGENLDVVGIAQAMRYLGLAVGGREVILLGAGGAAAALLYYLTKAGAQVWVVNRTAAHAQQLIARIAPLTAHLGLPDRLAPHTLVCSTLPAGSEVPGFDWSQTGLVFDSVYAHSPLEPVVCPLGLSRVGSLEWLYFQALAFFHQLFGHRPEVPLDHAAIIGQLKEHDRK